MSSPNIGYGDYSETLARQIAETVDGMPSNESIAENRGVSVVKAKIYRASLEDILRELGEQVSQISNRVTEFSGKAADSIAAIRAADFQAEEQIRAYFEKIDTNKQALSEPLSDSNQQSSQVGRSE